jgi:predicted transcriptional regulator
MAPKKKTSPPQAPDDVLRIPLSIRFDAEHLEKAKRLAKIKGVNRAAIIQQALAEKLERDLK